MRVAVAAALALFGAVELSAQQQEVRVFQLRFRAVRDAATLVEPLLSPEGSLLLQPRLNTLTVRDRRDALEHVAQALASWDVAPASYALRIRLLMASTAPATPGPASPLVSGIGAEMSKLFHYTSYQEVDTLAITASDGSPVEAALGDRYTMRFLLRAVPQDSERLQLTQLELSRRDKADDGSEILRPLLRSTVSLRLGQIAILGAARSETASQALLLVLRADSEERP